MPNQHHLKADLLLVVVTLLAAAGWIFSKETLQGIPPILFIGIRFLLAGLVLAMIGLRAFKALSAQALKRSLLTGAVFAIAMMFWIMGLFNAEHVGEGAFITSMGVVLVPIMARWIFGDSPPLSTWLALPVAISGLALLSLDNGLHLDVSQIFFLAAATIFALHFNLNTRMVAEVPVLVLTSIQLMVVGIVAFAVSWATEAWPTEVAGNIWGWLLASAIIATSLRFYLQTFAQGLAPASHAAVILTLEPIWTTLLAGLWFGEVLSVMQWFGCGLIFSALLINRWHWVKLALKGLRS
ncbi:DMT family transporter [Alkalimarinus sediminis]|uniref:DMT family transporter n=1 Tax=Alkalimarinus sediminis TaxID=1632866 RepID=A0A9E8HLF9_9ALTE|nr:DMT family transporter [Alkalimarinus sediminis]UZW74868.1 DMT family transporter [Alkalimarinus sediminis]